MVRVRKQVDHDNLLHCTQRAQWDRHGASKEDQSPIAATGSFQASAVKASVGCRWKSSNPGDLGSGCDDSSGTGHHLWRRRARGRSSWTGPADRICVANRARRHASAVVPGGWRRRSNCVCEVIKKLSRTGAISEIRRGFDQTGSRCSIRAVRSAGSVTKHDRPAQITPIPVPLRFI